MDFEVEEFYLFFNYEINEKIKGKIDFFIYYLMLSRIYLFMLSSSLNLKKGRVCILSRNKICTFP